MEMDWVWGLIGGLLIGLAGAILLLGNGRIMGASGILGGLVDGSGRGDARERLAFVAGVVVMPFVVIRLFEIHPETLLTSNMSIVVVAGMLVGIGTRIANGCTSGHGVCGISRLSLRGITATVIYILAGALMVLALRHWLGMI